MVSLSLCIPSLLHWGYSIRRPNGLWPCGFVTVPYGLKLCPHGKANELGNIAAVCLNPSLETWTGVEHSVGYFDLTNESLLSYQAYAII